MFHSQYNHISSYLRTNTIPAGVRQRSNNFRRDAKKYTLNTNGTLLRNGKPVVKQGDQTKIWNELHQHGDKGIAKMVD